MQELGQWASDCQAIAHNRTTVAKIPGYAIAKPPCAASGVTRIRYPPFQLAPVHRLYIFHL